MPLGGSSVSKVLGLQTWVLGSTPRTHINKQGKGERQADVWGLLASSLSSLLSKLQTKRGQQRTRPMMAPKKDTWGCLLTSTVTYTHMHLYTHEHTCTIHIHYICVYIYREAYVHTKKKYFNKGENGIFTHSLSTLFTAGEKSYIIHHCWLPGAKRVNNFLMMLSKIGS